MEGSIDLPILGEAAYISFKKPTVTVQSLELSHWIRTYAWKSYFLLVCTCFCTKKSHVLRKYVGFKLDWVQNRVQMCLHCGICRFD